jgi:hypothetical protein
MLQRSASDERRDARRQPTGDGERADGDRRR